jgi:hypothetical protein
MTKPITGVAMMILYEAGKWHPDDPLSKYIPEFASLKVYAGTNADGSFALKAPARTPTVGMLMSHIAGFSYGIFGNSPVDRLYQSDNPLGAPSLNEFIAKLSKLVPDVEPSPRFVEGFEEMGSRCEEMIRVALDSFGNRDLEGAESLVELDELIDRANRRVVGRILELGEAAAMREYGLRMVLVSRALERIGDHAVDIGEQVAYLLTAEFREFTDASHPQPR